MMKKLHNGKEKTLLIIPVYNEEENIARVIKEVKNYPQFFDILVIDDGSGDNTLNILATLNIFFISLPVNLGYGGALQLGYKFAVRNNYDTVIQLDGDGQHKASDITRLHQAYIKEEADIVIGSRFIDNTDTSTSFFRTLGNKLLSYLLFFFTKRKIRDVTSGFQILGRNVFEYYSEYGNFPDDYPDIDVLAAIIIKGNKIVEKGITINKRVAGKSMHYGLYFILYFFKTILSLMMVLIRHKTGKNL